MPIAPDRAKLVFRKMDRELRRLSSEQQPEAVHDFRTTSRRLEILLKQLSGNQDRNQKKLLKILSRIRKRAGHIRDLDVQLAALRSLKVAQEPRRKTQLVHRLIKLRLEHERKLRKLLKKADIREVRRRLKRATQRLQFDAKREPLVVARNILASVKPSSDQIEEQVLHQYRIAVKRARYAVEFAVDSAESAKLIAELKILQDALGQWHDWLTLTQTASDHLGEVGQSTLVTALHSVTRGKYRQAVDALSAIAKRSEILPAAPPKRAHRAAQGQTASSENRTAA